MCGGGGRSMAAGTTTNPRLETPRALVLCQPRCEDCSSSLARSGHQANPRPRSRPLFKTARIFNQDVAVRCTEVAVGLLCTSLTCLYGLCLFFSETCISYFIMLVRCSCIAFIFYAIVFICNNCTCMQLYLYAIVFNVFHLLYLLICYMQCNCICIL